MGKRAAEPKFVLVSLPWTNLEQPAFGPAILKAHLTGAGIAAAVYHANLDLLAYLSNGTYDFVSQAFGLNEFVFSGLLAPELDQAQLQSLKQQCEALAIQQRSPKYATPEAVIELFLALRSRVIPTYLALCAERIIAMEPTVVGFSCLFDQTIASVALARLLKEARPELMTVLGGYAVQHENGLEVLRAFPEIDCVARGEGEGLVVPLALASVGAANVDQIAGVATRGNLADKSYRDATRWPLALSMTPDYADWFLDLDRVAREHKVFIPSNNLPIESSRGCWWGQKNHCTFCGIDDETMKYRAKPVDLILAQIRELRQRHGVRFSFRFSDYIFPVDYYRALLPELAKFDPPAYFEAEIKANQTPDTIAAFADAGFVKLQPGIESFSTEILRKMKKGVSALQNVQLLKWAYLKRVEILYNLLSGFPDDRLEDYILMMQRMPSLYHLTPPISHSPIVVTRFAPLHTNPERYGYDSKPTHNECYDALFSQKFRESTGFDLDNYCYYFDHYYKSDYKLNQTVGQLITQATHWKRQHRERDVHLAYEKCGADYRFEDTRFGEAEAFVVSGMAAEIYGACDERARTFETLAEAVGASAPAGAEAVKAEVETMRQRRLVWVESNQVFGLAMPWDIVAEHNRTRWKTNWSANAF